MSAAYATGVLGGGAPVTSPTAPPGSTTATAPTTASFALPGEVTIDPGLPQALPLPDDIWDKTGPGWVLATYSPSVVWWNNDTQTLETALTHQVVYLVSPQGDRYQVLELDPHRMIDIESWTASENQAIIRETRLAATEAPAVIEILDLTTGAVEPYATPFPDGLVQVRAPDNVRVWDTVDMGAFIERDGDFTPIEAGWTLPFLGAFALSPDDEWVPMVKFKVAGGSESWIGVLSLDSGSVNTFPALDDYGACFPTGWAEASLLSVSCVTDSSGAQRRLGIDVTTGSVTVNSYTEPPPDAYRVERQLWVSPGMWAGKYSIDEPEADMTNVIGVDAKGVLTEVVLGDAVGNPFETTHLVSAVNGILYLQGFAGANDSFIAENVVTYDPGTGQQVILLPSPPAGPGSGTDPGSWGVTSWVVSP